MKPETSLNYLWAFAIAIVSIVAMCTVEFVNHEEPAKLANMRAVDFDPPVARREGTKIMIEEPDVRDAIIADQQAQIDDMVKKIAELNARLATPIEPVNHIEGFELTPTEFRNAMIFIEEQTKDVGGKDGFDESHSYRRKHALTEYLDRTIGEERRLKLEGHLWGVAEKYRSGDTFDHVHFWVDEKEAQIIFGVLCFPCDPNDRSDLK